MISVQGKIQPLDSGAFPYTFYVDVVDEKGNGAFRDDARGIIRQEVVDWCAKNCSKSVLTGPYEMVGFQTEEDALLFYLSFKR